MTLLLFFFFAIVLLSSFYAQIVTEKLSRRSLKRLQNKIKRRTRNNRRLRSTNQPDQFPLTDLFTFPEPYYLNLKIFYSSYITPNLSSYSFFSEELHELTPTHLHYSFA